MIKETIKYILTDFHESPLPESRGRSLLLPLDVNKVVALVGIRRSGKTYLLYRTMQRLIDHGVDKRDLLYLNFEDDRLFPVKLDDMDLILKAYHELYPEQISRKKYVFLDEIQQVPNWEKYIRRIYDTESVRIYVTGSSSKIVSREIAPALRGRTIHYEIFPLSFSEYLQFKDIEVKPYSTRTEARIVHALQDYLNWGSFPEVVLTEDHHLRLKILQEYSDLIL